MGRFFLPGAGQPPDTQHFGMYLGQVVNNRGADLWVQCHVPQVLGDQISNWARPVAFNSVGAGAGAKGPAAAIQNDGAGTDEHQVSLGWGGFNPPGTANGVPIGFGAEAGEGPAPGTIVMVWFVGGDANRPAYALTSQKVA